ncbi:MAG: hypothetical protein SGI89_03110 [bacterium]|nr:hypothetical protein [bacterium]
MQKIRYTVTTLSPILISKLSGDRNMTETFDYIPGRVMLGIFASKYIKAKQLTNAAHNDDNFVKYFLTDDVIFTNALLTKDNKDLVPTPFSIQKSKEDESVLCDLLFKEFDDEYEQTKYLGGYNLKEDSIVKHATVDKSLNFHHARDENTNTSKEGMIFNYESIGKDQEFTGYLIGEKIKDFKDIFKEEFEAFIGRSKTAQYGRIKVEMGNVEEYNPEVTTVNTLTFLSDVILYNENGQSTTDLSVLKKYIYDKLLREIKIDKAFIKTSRIDNYVSVWKLKKPSETAFASGSCFFISGLNREDIEKLKEIEKSGIGERRNEGLGRIKFGLQGEISSGKELKSESKNDDAPEIVPEIVKNIVEYSIQETIKRQIKSSAINDSIDFYFKNKKDALSNSLIGRLESFVKTGQTIEDFKSNLDRLRKTASDNIKKCNFDGTDFFEYMKNKNITASNITVESAFSSIASEDVKKLYNVESDTDFNRNLFKDYYLTFFSYLRKQMKGGKNK